MKKKLWICPVGNVCVDNKCKHRKPHKRNDDCGIVNNDKLCPICRMVENTEKQESGAVKFLEADDFDKKVPDLCVGCKHYENFCRPRQLRILNFIIRTVTQLLQLLGIKNCILLLYTKECERFEAKEKEE